METDLAATATSDRQLMEPLIPVIEALVSPTFIAIYCGVIVLYALWWLNRLIVKSRRLRKDLQSALKTIGRTKDEQQFAEQFEVIDKEISTLDSLKHAWSEFKENLIYPGSSEERVIRNCQESAALFSEDAIIKPSIDVRFYSSIPNHLTGLGILGTFIGLAAGIGLASNADLATGNIDAAQQALAKLLDGASLAFLTSITGLGSSFVFLLAERHYVSRLHWQLNTWVDQLDSRLKFVTPAQFHVDELKEMQKQTVQLQMLNTDIAVAIGDKVDQAITAHLGPTLEQLVEELRGLRADQQTAGEEMLRQVSEGIGSAVTEGAGQEMRSLATTLSELNGALGSSTAAVRDSQDQMRSSIQEVAQAVRSAMSVSAEDMREELREFLDGTVKHLDETTERLTEQLEASGARATELVQGGLGAVESSVNRMESVSTNAQRMVDDVERTASDIRSLAESLQDTHLSFAELIEPLQNAASSFRTAGEQTNAALQQISALAERTRESAERLEESQREMSELWGRYEERFANVDSSLARVFREIDEGTARYTEQVAEFTRTVDDELAKALQSLGGAVQELSEVAESLEETAGSRVR